MAKKRARKASPRRKGSRPFSTQAVIAAMEKALGQLREERKLRGSDWTIPQHIKAGAAELALGAAIVKCSCSTTSHSFPKHGLTMKTALK